MGEARVDPDNRATTRSQALYQRARSVIPKGVYGHYGPAIGEDSPVFFESSSGAHFTDIDGNTYVDWMCAYGPMILGYNHPVVDEAAARQMEAGNTVSLAAPVLVDLAEKLVDMVEGADWALFGKNGADSTTLAVMVARAATGRRYVVKVDGGYHGSAAWMQAPGNPGTISADHELVLTVPWNDVAALQQILDEHGDDVACFISSPYHHPVLADNELPAEGYWPAVEGMCRKAGVVIVADDVRAGFRINLAGSHVEYGFQPDMVCFGKALANGHPIAALVGTNELRQAAGDTFYTGTQFFNAAPMAAALATLQELEKIDGARLITNIGTRLCAGLVDVASSHGHDLRSTGVPGMPYFRIAGEGGFRFHARWIAECVRRGAYLLSYHNNFVSAAHSDTDLKATWDIADQAFTSLSSTELGS
ncbi:MAG: aminotransferase class III-fold pyridoxal phosphate-dependent enzyme [Actinomycetia bacterium]|nr:aminotransferase class III-fold pyridoxal phosphate-dependent enzyme [Actinomycetes bacterium]